MLPNVSPIWLLLGGTLEQADVQRKPDGLVAVVDEDGADRHHDRIILSPESTDERFKAITLVADGNGGFRVVAEFLMVL